MSETYKVEKEYNNARFDRWFKQKVLNIPQSLLEKLTRKSKIKINKKKIKTSYRVKTDDNVEILKKRVAEKNSKKKVYHVAQVIDDFCLISDEEDNSENTNSFLNTSFLGGGETSLCEILVIIFMLWIIS